MAEHLGQGLSGLHLHPGVGQCHTRLCNDPARKNKSARSDLTPSYGGETTIFSPATEQMGTARSTGNTGVAKQLRLGPSKLHLHQGAGVSHNTLCQGRAGHPGVLSQACRSTGGASTSERQQDQITSEITRWLKANIELVPTEIKATWYILIPILPQHQLLDTPTYQKGKIWI